MSKTTVWRVLRERLCFGFLVINVCNHGEHYETPYTYCFSTAAIDTRTCLIVTFIRKLPVLLCGYEKTCPAAWHNMKRIEHVWYFNPGKCTYYLLCVLLGSTLSTLYFARTVCYGWPVWLSQWTTLYSFTDGSFMWGTSWNFTWNAD